MNFMPSRIDFSFDESDERIQGALRALDSRRHVIRSLIPSGHQAYFQERARYSSAHSSTAIEGNPLSEEAALRVMVEGADPADPFQVEKANLEGAYQFVEQLASDKSLKVDEA